MTFFATMSPAKRFHKIDPPEFFKATEPVFKNQAAVLATMMATQSANEIADLMHVSASLAALNHQRYQAFFSAQPHEYLPSIFGFAGDAFKALEAHTFTFSMLLHCQSHLGILSGLYGLLRPFDQILPYRLEMGTPTERIIDCNLYTYWRALVTEQLDASIKKVNASQHLNLASEEYAKVIDRKALSVPTVDVIFARKTEDSYKIIGILAKRMRGHMARYHSENNPTTLEALKSFSMHDFHFSAIDSTDHKLVYLQEAA